MTNESIHNQHIPDLTRIPNLLSCVCERVAAVLSISSCFVQACTRRRSFACTHHLETREIPLKSSSNFFCFVVCCNLFSNDARLRQSGVRSILDASMYTKTNRAKEQEKLEADQRAHAQVEFSVSRISQWLGGGPATQERGGLSLIQ